MASHVRRASTGACSCSAEQPARSLSCVSGTLLAACGGSEGADASQLVLARPDNPVTHPLFDDNPAIASGLDPEQGPLRVYN